MKDSERRSAEAPADAERPRDASPAGGATVPADPRPDDGPSDADPVGESAGPRGSDHPGGTDDLGGHSDHGPTAGGPEDLASLIDHLDGVISRIATYDTSDLSVNRCEAAYARIERSMRRLSAAQTSIFSDVQRRRVETVEYLRPDDPKAGDKARRKLAEDLQQRTRQSPQELHRIDQTAQQLHQVGESAKKAFASGDLTQRHIQLLGETLRSIRPEDRDGIESELVEAGCTMDSRQFGQYCRRRLAEVDHERAADAQRARHERRSLKATMGDDGMLHLSGQFSGIDAETVATALHAFRRPDPARAQGEQRRTSEQVSADAFTQLCDTALRHKDSTAHGHRPQIIVTIDHATLLAGRGATDGIHAGAMPYDEVRRLLSDAGVARILTDPQGVPVEAGEMVRTVPAGLWRMLVVRDRGCFAATCDAPPGWCDVAHLDEPFHLEGRLAPDNAALACRYHHRMFDHHGWKVMWSSNRPTLHAPIATRSVAPSEIEATQTSQGATAAANRPSRTHATNREERPPVEPLLDRAPTTPEPPFEQRSLLAERRAAYRVGRAPPHAGRDAVPSRARRRRGQHRRNRGMRN